MWAHRKKRNGQENALLREIKTPLETLQWKVPISALPSFVCVCVCVGGGGSVTYMAIEVRGKHRVCNSSPSLFFETESPEPKSQDP